MRSPNEKATLGDVVGAMFLTIIMICAFNVFLGWLQKRNLAQIEANQQRLESRIKDVSLDVEILQLDDIGIFETLRAIEQDSFYSDE